MTLKIWLTLSANSIGKIIKAAKDNLISVGLRLPVVDNSLTVSRNLNFSVL